MTEDSLGEASQVPGRSGHKFWALCFTTIILPLQWGKVKSGSVVEQGTKFPRLGKSEYNASLKYLF